MRSFITWNILITNTVSDMYFGVILNHLTNKCTTDVFCIELNAKSQC